MHILMITKRNTDTMPGIRKRAGEWRLAPGLGPIHNLVTVPRSCNQLPINYNHDTCYPYWWILTVLPGKQAIDCEGLNLKGRWISESIA